MSTHHLSLAWRCSRSTLSSRLVLLALADAADWRGRVSLPQGEIAAATRLDVKTVQRAIGALVAMNEIEVETAAGGPGFPAMYRIAIAETGQSDGYSGAGAISDIEMPGNLPPIDGVQSPTIADRDEAPALVDDEQPSVTVAPVLTQDIEAATATAEGEPEQPQPALAPPPQPIAVPRHLPQSDVGRILAAACVRARPDQPFFWFRKEHEADAAALCRRIGADAATVAAALRAKGVSKPDLARIADLEQHIASRGK